MNNTIWIFKTGYQKSIIVPQSVKRLLNLFEKKLQEA